MIKNIFSHIVSNTTTLIITFIIILTCSSTLYSISEKTSWIEGLWWSIVTATTVGYGDSFPHGIIGKFTAVILMLTMVFLLIPAITARMASELIVDHDVFTHEEQEQIKNDLKETLRQLEIIKGEINERKR